MNKEANADYIIADLLNQIANLSKDKAVMSSLATEYKRELDALKQNTKKNKNAKK